MVVKVNIIFKIKTNIYMTLEETEDCIHNDKIEIEVKLNYKKLS